jgi:ABC-2 type transport system permease protein
VRSKDIIKTLLWKETREISRDRKFLATIITTPILSLTAIAFLTATLLYYQPTVIAIVSQDNGEGANWFVNNVLNYLVGRGYVVSTTTSLESVLRNMTIDLIVVIPEGFSDNLTRIDRVCYIEVIKRTSVSEDRVSRAEEDVKNVVSSLSQAVSSSKIKELGSKAGIPDINVEAVRNPIQVKVPIYISPTGEPAKQEDVLRPFIARLLILTYSFIVTPAATYIVDGIVGERERKTMEMLLASPAGLKELIVSKIMASSLIGLISSLSDLAGLLLYYGLLVVALGAWFLAVFDPVLLLLHSFTAFLSILVTVSISLPFITRTKGIRSASNLASLFSILGLAFYVAGWVIDFYKLPSEILNPLLIVPYTHSILAIQSYVYRDLYTSIRSIMILLALSTVLLYISLKTLDREKVLLAK